MSLQLSTGYRNKALGISPPAKHPAATLTATDITAVDNAGAGDTLTSDAAAFVTAGFVADDAIVISGFTGNSAACNGPFTIVTCIAATITLATATLNTGDAKGESVTISVIVGGSFRDIFKRGVLRIYTGTQPTTADLAATGTKLLEITASSVAFTGGAVAGGLEFGVAASGAIDEASTPDISTTLPRVDGSIATSGAQLNMSSTTITSGATTTIDTFTITLPAA
jgi:hypothetical protein